MAKLGDNLPSVAQHNSKPTAADLGLRRGATSTRYGGIRWRWRTRPTWRRWVRRNTSRRLAGRARRNRCHRVTTINPQHPSTTPVQRQPPLPGNVVIGHYGGFDNLASRAPGGLVQVVKLCRCGRAYQHFEPGEQAAVWIFESPGLESSLAFCVGHGHGIHRYRITAPW